MLNKELIDLSKINQKHLTEIFQKALPNENFDFQILSRDSLDTKIKNEIVCCELDIDNFSPEVLNYKQTVKSPDNYNQYSPISDLPYSIRDLSFSIKDFSKRESLEDYILGFKDEFLKKVYIFDYFYNEKNSEIKIGFRFVFQSPSSTITEREVNDIIGVIINHTQKIKGISIPGLN